MVFGGAGRADVRDAVLISCGNVSTCSGNDAGFNYTGGLAVWFKSYVAAEASYFRPPKISATGNGTNYLFNSTLDPQLIIVGGRVGIPIGPVRITGLIAMNYQDSTLKTHETINNVSQDFLVETRGWGWLYGPGIEIWTAPWLAIYADFGIGQLKGTSTTGGEVRLDDRLRYLTVGGRVRIGKK